MVNSFVASVCITVMIINPARGNVINLYWFHNGALEKTNSLNGHSKENWINEHSFIIPLVKQILLCFKNQRYHACTIKCVIQKNVMIQEQEAFLKLVIGGTLIT